MISTNDTNEAETESVFLPETSSSLMKHIIQEWPHSDLFDLCELTSSAYDLIPEHNGPVLSFHRIKLTIVHPIYRDSTGGNRIIYDKIDLADHVGEMI